MSHLVDAVDFIGGLAGAMVLLLGGMWFIQTNMSPLLRALVLIVITMLGLLLIGLGCLCE
jgi:hypothetical protein